MIEQRFDLMKDAANLQNHRLSLTFGERIFENEDHLIHPTIREQDSKERFKVIGQVAGKSFTGVFVWHDDPPRCISVRRSNNGEERAYRASS